MGFFDRLAGKKTSSSPATPSAFPAPAPLPADPSAVAGNILPRLAAARACLEAKDLPGALAIYEEVLAAAGDRADVLVTISGDLGSTGHIVSIIELIAPRYDAEKHGPATGLNILQAYLAVRHTDAAQHVLDILFDLNRPELEDRLHGFSNALAEMIVSGAPPIPLHGASGEATDPATASALPAVSKVDLVSISKPIWFYGLEPLADKILPPKAARVRRIAFAQLALPGAYTDVPAAQARPEDELGRLSRALPLWFAETFYFSPHYAPIAALGILHPPGDAPKQPFIFANEWTTENLRQLVESPNGDGLDYIFTGALRQQSGDYELLLRVWEVKKFRERKQFLVRWNPASADAELAKLHEQIRLFMEWTPEKSGLPYAVPASPRVWLDTLGASLGLFLAEKTLLPKDILPPLAPTFNALAPHAMSTASASLAWLTTLHRAQALGLAPTISAVMLSSNPHVAEARTLLA